MTAAVTPRLPLSVRARMIARLFFIQASWSYDVLIGTGLAFCLEPALRLLPGGKGGDAYRQALARQSRYFNAHPYLASVAVGALARVELDGVPPEKIERFREILCAPLGSMGDRLVWTAWLPLCVLVSLAGFAMGASPSAVVWFFLIAYNVGHILLRIWGLHIGWLRGLTVAGALAAPAVRLAPEVVSRAVAVAAGFAIPLATVRTLGSGRGYLTGVALAIVVGTVIIVRFRPRLASGWSIAAAVMSAVSLFAVLVQ